MTCQLSDEGAAPRSLPRMARFLAVFRRFSAKRGRPPGNAVANLSYLPIHPIFKIIRFLASSYTPALAYVSSALQREGRRSSALSRLVVALPSPVPAWVSLRMGASPPWATGWAVV